MEVAQSGLKNFGTALLHGVIVFIATYGGALVTTIPISVGQATVMSILSAIVSWAKNSITTPSGSTVVHPMP